MNELAKIAMKKRLMNEGLSEEEAERYIASMEEGDKTLEKLGKFAQAAEILSNAPQDARPALAPIAQRIVLGSDDDVMKDIKKMILQIKALELAFGGQKDSQQQEVISKILQELEDMKERALQAEMQKKEEAMEALRQELAEMKELIANIVMKGNETSTQSEEKKDITERIVEDLQQVNKMKELLKQLGMIKEGGGEIDKEKIIEMLRKEGYRIEGPPSWEVVERKLQEMMKKKEEEIRKEVEEELGVKKEKARMAFDFIL
ncbi:MAG: hypothetical protein J7K47_00515, partial [Thermoplasmata archaeon]|nr:hypothetical protein [Thermoplasmata archaeon]